MSMVKKNTHHESVDVSPVKNKSKHPSENKSKHPRATELAGQVSFHGRHPGVEEMWFTILLLMYNILHQLIW